MVDQPLEDPARHGDQHREPSDDGRGSSRGEGLMQQQPGSNRKHLGKIRQLGLCNPRLVTLELAHLHPLMTRESLNLPRLAPAIWPRATGQNSEPTTQLPPDRSRRPSTSRSKCHLRGLLRVRSCRRARRRVLRPSPVRAIESWSVVVTCPCARRVSIRERKATARSVGRGARVTGTGTPAIVRLRRTR